MFNLSGSEIVVILLLALIVLGPDKLPDAMRRAGKTFAEIKKLSTGFQDEVRKGFEEPVKEVKKTAAAVKSATKLPIDVTARATDKKPRYNPATDPPPEHAEGSSVAEPATPAAVATDAPNEVVVNGDESGSSPTADAPVADDTTVVETIADVAAVPDPVSPAPPDADVVGSDLLEVSEPTGGDVAEPAAVGAEAEHVGPPVAEADRPA